MNTQYSLTIDFLHVNYERRNTVVVGAPFDNEGGLQTGSVFVYKEVSEDDWQSLGNKITPTDGEDDDAFGYSVGIDEVSTILIGSKVSAQDQCVMLFFIFLMSLIIYVHILFAHCRMQQRIIFLMQVLHMFMISQVRIQSFIYKHNQYAL
jgi:hypothetical protein